MSEPSRIDSSRLDMMIAFMIAIVSITFAFAAWRISNVSSNAGDAARLGILDSIKKQAAMNEDWRQTYQEANYAESYAAYLAQVNALQASGEAVAAAEAANLRQYLLPSLQLLADPLTTDTAYLKADGSYDLQKRFDTLEAASPDLRDLDPQASFQLADRYYAEQRWLTIATVLLAISLFWLALAEVSRKRQRMSTLIIGVIVYGAGLVSLAVIEAVFFFLRGGTL